jgi:hypothetical protein
MQLKEAAGWNQTEDDWRCLLWLEPNGCFGAIKDGRLVGLRRRRHTATNLPG